MVDEAERLRGQISSLSASNRVLRQQRQMLALRVSGLTGEPWEEVLASVGVEPQTPRDPGPTAPIKGG